MKKTIAIVLLSVMVFFVAMPAYAIYDTQNKILEHYEEEMEGSWELEDFDWNTEKWTGLPSRFTFNKSHLSITYDNRVFYQWDNKNYQTNGGEVLLCRWLLGGRDRIGFVFTVNGTTCIAYYLKVIK